MLVEKKIIILLYAGAFWHSAKPLLVNLYRDELKHLGKLMFFMVKAILYVYVK